MPVHLMGKPAAMQEINTLVVARRILDYSRRELA